MLSSCTWGPKTHANFTLNVSEGFLYVCDDVVTLMGDFFLHLWGGIISLVGKVIITNFRLFYLWVGSTSLVINGYNNRALPEGKVRALPIIVALSRCLKIMWVQVIHVCRCNFVSRKQLMRQTFKFAYFLNCNFLSQKVNFNFLLQKANFNFLSQKANFTVTGRSMLIRGISSQQLQFLKPLVYE